MSVKKDSGKAVQEKAAVLWNVANTLAGLYKPHEYGLVILPMAVIKRFHDCLLPTHDKVLKKAEEIKKLQVKGAFLTKASGYQFYNTSKFTFETLCADAKNIARNFRDYLNGFSENVKDILDQMKFDDQVDAMDKGGVLYQVICDFNTEKANLSPDEIGTEDMGYIFENLVQRFSESYDEHAGAHFTSRDIIYLMCDLLVVGLERGKGGALADTLSAYDMAMGTSQMLTCVEDRLKMIDPSVQVLNHGQEINPFTYGIAKGDMLIRGGNPESMRYGNTLDDDKFPETTFNLVISNPPFGIDWKKEAAAVEREHRKGDAGRFAPGLPSKSDGQVFQGGSTTIDTTATDRDGYPLYTVHDVNDIFDIACSVVFVDEGRSVSFSEAVHSQLAIGTFSETEDRPGGKFVPQTASGELMSDTFVRWTPTRAGDYMLEHWVLNNGVEIGYRRAYFDFHGVDGEEPVTARNLITRVVVTRAGTGERIDYTSLAAAVAELRYGDAITIVQDVQMENEKIPSGSTVTVEGDGVFRRTQESDLARPYHTADVTLNANGKVTNAVFRLDDEKVRPSMDGKGLFGLSEGANGREFTFTIGNVKPDLYYIVRRSDDIRTWTVASKVYAAGETDSLTVSLPAETEKGFFNVSVTDDPSPAFRTEDDGSGGVTVKGADTLGTGDFAGRLVIPAVIGGKSVTGVGASAFANRADIRSVDVLSGVAALGANAFKWCVNLSSVSLCDGLATIGDGAFDGTAITELVIPASVAKVGSLDLRGLRTLRFLGKPSEIGNLLLSSDCLVYVPQDAGWAGVPSADWHGGQLEYRVDFTCTTGRVDGVFEVCITGCENIPSDRRLRIPQTIDGMPVAAIGERAFEDKGRSVLTEVIIPEGVREIGGGAFCGCDGLVALELPASLLSLGRCAFGKAENLSSIVSLSFAGNAPDYDGDVYLDPVKCVLGVRVGASGWGDTWQGCRVEFRGADGLIYHPLAYIEATQGAYVDTLYRPNQNTRVTMDVTVRGEMEYWFGCWTNDYNRGAFCLGNDGEWGIYFAVCDDGGSFFHDGGRVPAGRHTVELTPWEFKVDGTTWAAKPEASRKDFRLDLPLYLFAQNRKGSAFVNAEQGTITCHGCTISENGLLKRKFVPCRRESDGAYGFYDAVEGAFYGNMGSGMFYGPKDMK